MHQPYHDPFIWHLVSTILVVAGIVYFFTRAYLDYLGKEKVVVCENDRTPFSLHHKDEESMTIATDIVIANEGKQCCTIMDAFVRPLLPSEQYDGVFVRGRVVRHDAEREDDYFEAVLIERGDKMSVRVEITFIPRNGKPIDEALAAVPDFLAELIWEETGRTPWHYEKVSLHIAGKEVAKLAGVEYRFD
ncbi:hypothetical protein TAMA11512_14240 [Selenomonas sp. TAMA-11512]|uniref:hypothetical protein n=1 Tax=Selenomonas sp. TAMA-11512 TaxID=3095337 RepID=UPI00308A06C3|nr:hypothetical protein TAMA11512_14240 [Selenomonas sp. TAMA-11512]